MEIGGVAREVALGRAVGGLLVAGGERVAEGEVDIAEAHDGGRVGCARGTGQGREGGGEQQGEQGDEMAPRSHGVVLSFKPRTVPL